MCLYLHVLICTGHITALPQNHFHALSVLPGNKYSMVDANRKRMWHIWSQIEWGTWTFRVPTLSQDYFLWCWEVYIRALFFWTADGRAFSNAYFGAGSGPIFLDDVQCTSSASKLLECPSRPILSHNCLHTADAGVGCEGVFWYRVMFTLFSG